MKIETLLKENNKRITPERIALFDFLRTKHIFTCNDLLNHFTNIWRASIFRTLNLFLDLGVIRKIELGNKVITYEMNHKKDHHEHMKCEKCSSIISFDSGAICKKLWDQAKEIWFKIKSHNIGILWTCKNCL